MPRVLRSQAVLRMFLAVIIGGGAALAGYSLTARTPEYGENATLLFSLPKAIMVPRTGQPNAYLVYARSLITTGEAITQGLASPQAQRQIPGARRRSV
jgi:hypothetical protein